MHMLFGLSRHWGAGVPRETGHKRGYTAHTCRGGVCVCVCVCAGNLCHLELLQSRQILPGEEVGHMTIT